MAARQGKPKHIALERDTGVLPDRCPVELASPGITYVQSHFALCIYNLASFIESLLGRVSAVSVQASWATEIIVVSLGSPT